MRSLLFLLGWLCLHDLTLVYGASSISSDPEVVVPRHVVSISYSDLEEAFAGEESRSDDLPPHLIAAMEQAFGPDGLGFLEVTHIPNDMVELRKRVLQLAPKLAQLPQPQLDDITRPDTMYTIGWSHGQEEFRPGVPDTRKASFYFDPYVAERNVFPTKHSSSSLLDMEALVMEMTHFMTQVGLWIAQLCDVYLQHKHNNKAIYESLKSCDQTKARLLYYFPPTESTTTTSTSSSSSFDDWCGWHKDHGSLTALLPGLLDDDDDDGQNSTECATNSNTIIGDSTTTKPGLYIQTTTTNNDRQDDPVHVPLPPTSLGFQLGETLEIMSRGRLRATPHAVRGGTVGSGGRSSLAVFLQPQASQSLPPLVSSSHDESLQARWRPTFGTFQKATTQAFQSTTAQN